MLATPSHMTVWMTAFVLLIQTVSPQLGVACGCSSHSDITRTCCCVDAARADSHSSPGCPHCAHQSNAGEVSGVSQCKLGCDCDEFVPHEPAQNDPESPTSNFFTQLETLVTTCSTEAVVACKWRPSRQVLSFDESHGQHYRQIMLRVWLT